VKPDLTSYDFIVVNSSAGKDSQAMLDRVTRLARAAGVAERVIVVHCNLGRVEWQGTAELAREQAQHYGHRYEEVSRRQGDLLDHVRARRMWPSSAARYCTSDHKRDQVAPLLTRLAREAGRRVRILQCMGHRAQESSNRAKLAPFENDRRNTNGARHVDIWRPIFRWKLAQVWQTIRASGCRHHGAYDLGMPRLSCCFCVLAPKSALVLAGRHNPELLEQYVQLEEEIGHTFRKGFRIADVKSTIDAGETCGSVTDWSM
jgi:3'-phosphoadenosine 5'-phosphosulfate sulfotransferase (PAPS reductase)/FAD synthetase